ncbi:MAG TPA: VanZ family protein [Thermoanaerobaculia bacterium]|jgi:VanZ family protein|nr:VanZ family protein [Thermoanaerobaculia bacterium]
MRLVRTWLPVLLWAAIILSASNDTFSSGNSQSWLSTIFGREAAHALNVVVRKLGHVLVYAILGILAWRADRRMIVALAVAAIVAILDETKQSMTLLRTGSPWDVLLDLAGAWLGVTAARRFVLRRTRQSA